MKTFEQFDNIDEKEKLFLEVAHLDELVIKFDFIEYEYDLYYFYKDNCLFDQNKKTMYFYIRYIKIWSVFEKKFGINFQEIKDFMLGMINKYFKLKNYIPFQRINHSVKDVDEHFKL